MARWLPVLAGAALVAVAPLLWWREAPEAVTLASALAGTTLALVAWPQREGRDIPLAQVASWAALARDLRLQGAVADGAGRLFLPSRAGTPPPLDDGRSLHDGSDGYASGIALANPLRPTLDRWLAADPSRLRDRKALEEDLNALAAWTAWMANVRVLPEPAGLRLRWEPRPAPGKEASLAVAWLLAAAVAHGASRRVRLAAQGDHEALLEWVA